MRPTKTIIALPLLLIASGLLVNGAQQQETLTEELFRPPVTSSDCNFLENPDEFIPDAERRYTMRTETTLKPVMTIYAMTSAGDALDANAVPRKNFIDDAIFSRMTEARIQSAPLASDAEFLRRVMLDLTGRIPSASDVSAFLADTNPSKRDQKIDALIGSPEFVDKWTMFFSDLYKVNANASNVNRYFEGRDIFYTYLKDSIASNKPYNEMARELISATGDSFLSGSVNWVVGNTVTMGPAQDTYDGHAVNLSSMFLGISSVDCLLCHDGARHLDEVNLWGSEQTRQNMWGLSAYFARTRMARQVVSQNPTVAKTIVSNLTTGDYRLNTTTGNRSARQPINGVSTIFPRNPFSTAFNPFSATGSGILPGESYRTAIARQVTEDIQFSRAAVNYIWEKFMVEAFVSPSNSFDLARLDPNAALPAGWEIQPTNAALLNSMATWFQQSGYNIRALMGLITKSSAYQLSATYPGNWDIRYVPYYARKYVRRLDAEEIHDAIVKATGISGSYTLRGGYLPPVSWAMQFPDTREPLSNGGVAAFLNAFGRGDRDTNFRRNDGSVLQALNMMNNTFVMGKIHQNNAGSRVAQLLGQNSDPGAIIQQLFLHTLSRPATDEEVAFFMPSFQAGNRAGAESLQWVLLNKLEFIFNY